MASKELKQYSKDEVATVSSALTIAEDITNEYLQHNKADDLVRGVKKSRCSH